ARHIDIGSIPDGGFLPFTIDFAGPGSFDPEVGRATVRGLGVETTILESMYLSNCEASFFNLDNVYGAPPVDGAFPTFAVPGSFRRPGEREVLSLFVAGSDGLRSDSRVYDPLAKPSLVLPPALRASVTPLPGQYQRFRFSYTWPLANGGPLIQFSTPY